MANRDKNKIAICWNKCSYVYSSKLQIEQEGYDVVVCDNFSSLDKIDWVSINYIIVLCELQWSEKSENNFMSELKGIELAQRYFRVTKQLCQPILFLSFLKRKEIQNINSTNEIVSAKGLQHGFRLLPSKPAEWINILKKMRLLTKLEWIDTLHFCKTENMAAEIRHDAMGRNLSKPELETLLDKLSHIVKISNELHELKNKLTDIRNLLNGQNWANQRNEIEISIKNICDKIEDKEIKKIEQISNSNENKTEPNKYKILWLEDELQTIELLLKWHEANKIFEFIVVPTPEKLYTEVDNDVENNISIIICDNRIRGIDNESINDKTPVLLEQGYTCIENIYRNHKDRYYKYVLLSELPRDFKIQIAESLGFEIFNKSKSKHLVNMSDFICFLEREAKKVRESVDKKGFTNSNFIRFYNYLKTNKNGAMGSFENIEKDITRRALALINYYKEYNKLDYKSHFFNETYIKNNKIVDKKTIQNCTLYVFPHLLNDDKNNESDNFCYYYPKGLLHNVSVPFREKKKKSTGSDIQKTLTSLIRKMLNLCIRENWNKKNFCKNSFSNKLSCENWGKGIGGTSKTIIIDTFSENFKIYGKASTANEYVKMIQKREDYHELKSEFLANSISHKYLSKKDEVDYIYQDENDIDNIYSFVSKLVARRVAQYLHSLNDDDSKPLYTLKQLYGFFGKDSGFGSHDIDLQLGKIKKETIEEKRFREAQTQ
jgi:hypothetical protein